jgi:hypothetical protein
MEFTDRIAALEDEINVLKTEIKAVLVDIRDELMKKKGPFAAPAGESRAKGPADPGLEADSDDLDIYAEPTARILKLDAGARGAGHEPATLIQPPAPAAAAAPDDLVTRLSKMAHGGATMPSRQAPAPGAPREWGVLDIASMGKWAEAATRRVGRKRLEELLGVYQLLTGEPQQEPRDALLLMLDLCGANHEPANVSMNDIVTVLSQLDALFRGNAITEVTVLSLLSDAA